MTKLFTYSVHEVAEYINWSYFFHAWGFPMRFASIASVHGCDSCRALWLAAFPEEERAQASEAMQLYKEAGRMLSFLDGKFGTKAICRLCEAGAVEDDIYLDGVRFPLLRQQTNTCESGDNYLCLSDFVRPLLQGGKDCVGVFAATVDTEMETLFSDEPYKRLLMQTLAERLAEATVEVMHEYVRRQMWGYAPTESLTVAQLHREEFQGIRPAVGYPSLPDMSVNFLIDELLRMTDIGITLTEHGAMQPHASVSGLMLSHPSARYFSVGKISGDQLADYAIRRGLPVAEMEKFLRHLL